MRMRMVILLIALAGCSSKAPVSNEAQAVPDELLQRQLDLGVGYLRQGDYQRAKEKLNRALQIAPRDSTVHATFGVIFQLEGEPELAEKYFKAAIRHDPQSAQARNSYGAFLFSEKRYEDAVVQLEKASQNRFYPNRPTVFENLGVAYVRLGDVEKAEYAFSRAIQLNPEQPRALIELADIRFNQQKYVESRELYSRHTKIAPSSAKRLWLCVRLARVFKNHNEEASCGEALEGIFPATSEYRQYQESR